MVRIEGEAVDVTMQCNFEIEGMLCFSSASLNEIVRTGVLRNVLSGPSFSIALIPFERGPGIRGKCRGFEGNCALLLVRRRCYLYSISRLIAAPFISKPEAGIVLKFIGPT